MLKEKNWRIYDYRKMDPIKILAQKLGRKTAGNLSRLKFAEVAASRGESAGVIDCGSFYLAIVIEGLGTKNLVADQMEKLTGKTYYQAVAQDAVAMIVNDLLTVGADPVAVPAYFGLGSDQWLKNKKRVEALIKGWVKACDLAGASYPGGETPVLSGIINPETIDLAGAAVGIIKPKKRLIVPTKIKTGDKIVLIESSGVHANGISLIRKCINKLPDGYLTRLKNGRTLGETLLSPTHIYAELNRKIFKENIDIHYLVNITGHGWRKLMRAEKKYTYEIDFLPPIPEEFGLIQKMSGLDLKFMYGNYNMGAGWAYYVAPKDAETITKIAGKLGYHSWIAGTVNKGPKQLIIKPLKIVYRGFQIR